MITESRLDPFKMKQSTHLTSSDAKRGGLVQIEDLNGAFGSFGVLVGFDSPLAGDVEILNR
jgi:hypothetical protein